MGAELPSKETEKKKIIEMWDNDSSFLLYPHFHFFPPLTGINQSLVSKEEQVKSMSSEISQLELKATLC